MNIKKADLHYDYPSDLVALEPQRPSRVMRVKGQSPSETTLTQLLNEVQPGDVWVVNNTRVMPRRLWSGEGYEILFLNPTVDDGGSLKKWQVLFPASKVKLGGELELPGGVKAHLEQKGLPQVLVAGQALGQNYFDQYGELPLPPYIQKLRQSRHQTPEDSAWYQTAWAEYEGSLAAPTASLHFSKEHIQALKDKGVHVVTLTLHVGLGTFLPIQSEDLSHHQMHKEWVEISAAAWATVTQAKARGAKIWALGTTVTRALESAAAGLLEITPEGGFIGDTQLFLYPGVKIQVVDQLMTNFHQPESTLMALVAAFQDLATVKSCYAWAIERRFRLFSYGDLSVWDVHPKNC